MILPSKGRWMKRWLSEAWFPATQAGPDALRRSQSARKSDGEFPAPLPSLQNRGILPAEELLQLFDLALGHIHIALGGAGITLCQRGVGHVHVLFHTA